MTQHDTTTFDVIVIGAGASGCCTARELARYQLSCAVLDAGNDIACATTRANSGIVHSGYDPRPGTLKAHYCVRGSRRFPQWAAELGFGYWNNGSLVVAFTEDEHAVLPELMRRGITNGVEGLRLVEATELLEMEPQLARDAKGALLAPSGAICDPYGLAFSAAENAAENGVSFLFNRRVVGIRRQPTGGFELELTDSSTLCCWAVVNAAGVYADELNNLVSAEKLTIVPVRGEYLLYDTPWGDTFHHTMFQTPGPRGKGVLVTPTIHGNLIVGPNAIPQEDKNDTSTTEEGMDSVLEAAKRTWREVSTQGVISNFAGLRAKGANRDFVIGEAPDVPGFFNIACFESPGLTAAPAVAEDVAAQVASRLGVGRRADFNPRRRRADERLFAMMDDTERAAAIARDPRYGHVVCRCCTVTEAEIVRELEGVLPVLTLDALKWRTGALMGRCHGGFCVPELVRIVTAHTELLPEEIDRRLAGSRLLMASSPEYARRRDAAKAAAGEQDGTNNIPPADSFDVIVIGAGAAGLAAASAAQREGARVLLLDRQGFLGGILRQCIHSGFGLERFGTELTGPEYAAREAAILAGAGVEPLLHTTVLSVERVEATSFAVRAVNGAGMWRFRCRAVVLATGSRERGQGALRLAGSRPAGVFSAGSAQDLINLEGCLPGRRVLIQGSGDIGLIMARRCVFAGAEVLGVFARSARPSGLRRNVIQCLEDFGIPFFGGRVATRLEGSDRLEAVWVSRVDPQTKATIPGTEQRIACDTLLLSIGLLPESEVAQTAGVSLDARGGKPLADAYCATDVPGVYVCGNALRIHDLADHASMEGELAGAQAARHALGLSIETRASAPEEIEEGAENPGDELVVPAVPSTDTPSADASTTDTPSTDTPSTVADDSVSHAVSVAAIGAPVAPSGKILEMSCTRCPKGCDLVVTVDAVGAIVGIEGNDCRLGRRYAEDEISHPTRVVTASLYVRGSLEPVSVKTTVPVPREKISEVLAAIQALEVTAPITLGQVLIENVADTGATVIATKSLP